MTKITWNPTNSHRPPQLIIQEAFESIFYVLPNETLKVGGCLEVVCMAVTSQGLRQIQGAKTDLHGFA